MCHRCLYSTFASPWVDTPATKDPHFTLPSCYNMQPPALKTGHLQEFTLETLFYIFYTMPRDSLQAYAAQELYRREWRYHQELRLWFALLAPDKKQPGPQPNAVSPVEPVEPVDATVAPVSVVDVAVSMDEVSALGMAESSDGDGVDDERVEPPLLHATRARTIRGRMGTPRGSCCHRPRLPATLGPRCPCSAREVVTRAAADDASYNLGTSSC